MIINDKKLLEALITKYGKSGVNLAINRLNESQESKSIGAAKRLLIDNGYTPEFADKFIKIDLRNDFPILRDKKSGKFILGVTRMFLKNELIDTRIISQLNTTLKYISDESHYNEYDRNLNNETAKTLIDRFNIEVEKDIEKQKDKISSKEYTKNDEYDIVKIDSFEEAKKYSRYVSWCITESENMYDNYIHDGIGQYYFILKRGFETIKKNVTENTPLDEYGLSMIAVSVDEKGQLNTCTCRWNHDNGGNDKILNSEQISDLIGENFYDVFKPNDNYKNLINRAISEIQQGKRDKDLLFNNIYKIKIANGKCVLIDANNKCEIKSITIPNSVTEIIDDAFYECSSLTSIAISDNVKKIGHFAFGNCTSLTSVTIPNSITSIGNSVFSGCTSLISVTIPNSITEIRGGTFADCESLKSVTIPNSITEIGHAAFQGCTSLKSVTMSYSVRSIRESAFSGCSSLTDITIPNSVTEIREYAFEGCTSLVNINIPNEAEISKDAFKDTKIKNENENINDDFEQREVIYSVIYNALEDACLYLQKVGIEITEDVVRTGVDWFDLHNEFYEI